jgi:hypothetical protein
MIMIAVKMFINDYFNVWEVNLEYWGNCSGFCLFHYLFNKYLFVLGYELEFGVIKMN